MYQRSGYSNELRELLPFGLACCLNLQRLVSQPYNHGVNACPTRSQSVGFLHHSALLQCPCVVLLERDFLQTLGKDPYLAGPRTNTESDARPCPLPGWVSLELAAERSFKAQSLTIPIPCVRLSHCLIMFPFTPKPNLSAEEDQTLLFQRLTLLYLESAGRRCNRAHPALATDLKFGWIGSIISIISQHDVLLTEIIGGVERRRSVDMS